MAGNIHQEFSFANFVLSIQVDEIISCPTLTLSKRSCDTSGIAGSHDRLQSKVIPYIPRSELSQIQTITK